MSRKTPIQLTRNFGIMAHIDAGKTTTSERILFHTKKIHKIGEIHDGEATMDWMEQEKERGITITSAATTASWKGHHLNLIDTPGHVDFTVEVERSLRVLDGAVAVLDGQAGVEPQTETVWRQAVRYEVPRVIFVNKMDKTGADFDYSVNSVRTKLGAKVAPVQYPIGKETYLKGIIDIVERKAWFMDQGKDENMQQGEIPTDLVDTVEMLRSDLIDKIAEYDEAFMMKVLDGKEVTVEEIKSTIRKAVLTAQFHPVFCGSAYKNTGVKLLLDGVIEYLPSPIDVPAIEGTDDNGNPIVRKADDNEPFSALAFKIMTDPYVGKLTFFRVYSGKLEAGSYVYNSTKGKKERISRILEMHANQRTEIDVVHAGGIAAAVGLKDTTTGNTLCSEDSIVVLESMNFPEPVISLAVEPKTKADSEKLSLSLGKLAEEDPTFKTWVDHETGQTIIAGMGELHLEIIVDRLKREFNVNANVGAPQVSYRETITIPADVESKYIKQSGGRGQYGHVWVKFEPNPDKGYEFVDKIVGGKIPKEYISSINKGFEERVKAGILAGYPLIDIKATIFDGSYHDVDSSEMAYKIAASKALQKARDACKAVLLEPIMKVEVTVPQEYFGDIMGDISARRGQLEGQEERGNAMIIKAKVPLSSMFGYATSIRSMSQGRASYAMEFSNYAQAPRNVADEIIKKRNIKDSDED